MKPFLMLAVSFMVSSVTFASDEVTILKQMTCETPQIRVEVSATHTLGDRIALIEWTVFKDGRELDYFMSPLSFVDQTLESFGGSTLGSDIWIEGSVAEFLLMNDTYKLICK